jgi:hypothetical protein
VRWVRRYWDEEDLWFYFELNDEGWVTRQVEFRGASGRAVTAASRSEWFEELHAGRIQLYRAKFGIPADQPISLDELGEYEPMLPNNFEELWQRARLHLSDQAEP